MALGYVLGALVVAELVDRQLSRRGKLASERVAGGELSPVATTRLRLVRRLIFALIILIGLALALWQFESVRTVGSAILAWRR